MKVKTVLLIDDNDIDTYINQHVISRSNIADSIVTKNSAIKAIDYLNVIKCPDDFPEIIFLDIRMPEMDGFGFLEQYNELNDELKQKCTIIMLTSSIDDSDIERAMNNPLVKKYLNKPLQACMLSDIFEIAPVKIN